MLARQRKGAPNRRGEKRRERIAEPSASVHVCPPLASQVSTLIRCVFTRAPCPAPSSAHDKRADEKRTERRNDERARHGQPVGDPPVVDPSSSCDPCGAIGNGACASDTSIPAAEAHLRPSRRPSRRPRTRRPILPLSLSVCVLTLLRLGMMSELGRDRDTVRRKCSWCFSASASLSRMKEERSSLFTLKKANN